MAIDYIVDLDCVPKQTLSTPGILERVKGRQRAEVIIAQFRAHGDQRPPTEMGFEFTRQTAEGHEETQIIVVQHLLDHAADLDPLAPYCADCPANVLGRPFGCMGQIHYPISGMAEAWLLERLPDSDELLLWMLLRDGIRKFNYDGSSVAPLRQAGDTHFAEQRLIVREIKNLNVNSNQVFEMTFLLGNIQPNHGGVLLLFFGVIDRNLEADQIMQIGSLPLDQRQQFRFMIEPAPGDDDTTTEIKDFLFALYTAWQLDVQLILDV